MRGYVPLGGVFYDNRKLFCQKKFLRKAASAKMRTSWWLVEILALRLFQYRLFQYRSIKRGRTWHFRASSFRPSHVPSETSQLCYRICLGAYEVFCANGRNRLQLILCERSGHEAKKTLGGRCDFGLASDILIFLKLCLDRKSYGE